MARQRAFRAPVGRRQRQPTNWARFVESAIVTVPAASKALITTVTLSNPGINETVRRTRGRIDVSSDQAVTQENQFGAFGAVVVSDTAVAAGAASLPGPVTDASDDGWFLWVPFMQTSGSSIGGSPFALGIVSEEFDSKAMRRIEEGFTVAFMVENAHATFGLDFAVAIALLSSLS